MVPRIKGMTRLKAMSRSAPVLGGTHEAIFVRLWCRGLVREEEVREGEGVSGTATAATRRGLFRRRRRRRSLYTPRARAGRSRDEGAASVQRRLSVERGRACRVLRAAPRARSSDRSTRARHAATSFFHSAALSHLLEDTGERARTDVCVACGCV